MSEKELNLSSYIDFTYNRFMMTRVEYLIYTQDEEESKVLRIIEWCIENERAHLYREAKARTPQGQKVEIPEIIWVPISHRFFMDQLHGTVQSKNTLKEKLASLISKHLIFMAPGGSGQYDAQIFTINRDLMADLAKLLPPTLDDVDMMAIMKKERHVTKIREGQKLTPSKIDPLVKKIRESTIDPLDPQKLTLWGVKYCPPVERRGGQKLTPIIYKDKHKEKEEESNASSANATDATHSLSQENDALKAELAAMKEQMALILSQQQEQEATVKQSLTVEPDVAQSATTPEPEVQHAPSKQEASSASYSQQIAPAKPEDGVRVSKGRGKAAKVEQMSLPKSFAEYTPAELKKLSEQDLMALISSKQKEILQRWRSLFVKAPVKLDGKLAQALYDLEQCDPSAEDLRSMRDRCYAIDIKSERFPRGYYHTRGVKLWDVVEHAPDWYEEQERAKAPAPIVDMTTYAKRPPLPSREELRRSMVGV